MVGGSGFSPVIRHSFVRAAPRGHFRKPCGAKMIRFPPSPGDQPAAPATKPAHLLRLTRHPQPYSSFEQNSRRSTCGFVFALFGMVGGKRLNVVDGPVLWRPPRPRTKVPPRRRETPPWRLGVGWGLCFWLPASGPGPLAPGTVSLPSAYGCPRSGHRRRTWRRQTP